MSKKRYDAVVKVGEYTDRNGESKTRWLNIGAVLQTENGHCLLLDRTFNPAGVADPENRGTVMVSLFEPKAREQGQAPAPAREEVGVDDDIPF